MSKIIQTLFSYNRSPIGATDVTIPLKYLKDTRGRYVTAMPAGVTIMYGTIEPRSNTNQESFSFTGIQNDGNNMVTLTGVTRNLDPQPPYTALTPDVPHGNSVEIILSNSANFYESFLQSDSDAEITASFLFPAGTPVYGRNPATKDWVISMVSGGAVSYDRQTMLGTAGENLAIGDSIYLKESDQKWWKTDADITATFDGVKLAIAQSVATTNTSVMVLLNGLASGFTGLTLGSKYYISNTSGQITTSSTQTTQVFLGVALSATTLLFSPREIYIPTALEKASIASIDGLVGVPLPTFRRTAPTGYVMLDGSDVARTGAYANLFSVLCPSQTFTVTIASPAVFTKVAHGLVAGDKLHFTTTGGLPSGLALNTIYYVLSTGLTADAFRVALSPEGTAVVTSGSQSGVHTFYISNYGKGNGSTTFTLPAMGSLGIIGRSSVANTIKLDFESGAVNIGTDIITLPSFSPFPYQGQKVQLTTTGTLPTGLSLATDYYVIRVSSTTIKLATTQANANASTPVAIDITGVGSGVHTIVHTLTARTIGGQVFGEEEHSMSVGEMPAHTHGIRNDGGTAGSTNNGSAPADGVAGLTTSTGGNGLHNNLSPQMALNYMTKY